MVDAWWRGSYGTIQLLKKDDVVYVLDGWNGKLYTDCYKSDLRGIPTSLEDRFCIRPTEPEGYEVILSTD